MKKVAAQPTTGYTSINELRCCSAARGGSPYMQTWDVPGGSGNGKVSFMLV
jgi:hypothetical protein